MSRQPAKAAGGLTLAQLTDRLRLPTLKLPPPSNVLGYVALPNQTALSYSKLSTFYECPRKFQLKELKAKGVYPPTIHTAFGHALAGGIQKLWETFCIETSTLELIRLWDYSSVVDIWEKDKTKSLFHCITTLQLYYSTQFYIEREEWQLAPNGVELLIFLQLNKHFNYQGHIDLILENRFTGAFRIVEIKTSKYAQTAPVWQNSLQTKGYHSLLSAVKPNTHNVISYICIQTGKLNDYENNFGITQFHFDQSCTQCDFPLHIMQDVATIQMYLEDNYFPTRGSSCVDKWGNACQFFGSCHEYNLQAEEQNPLYTSLGLEDCDYVLTLENLLEAQNNYE